jgi:glyoxylate reductase
MRHVVVVTRRLPEAVERRIAERFDARLNASDEPMSADALADAFRQADGVLCTVTDRIDCARARRRAAARADRRELRRRLQPHPRRRGAGARDRRHEHARGADRGHGRHRARADPHDRAPARRGRAARAGRRWDGWAPTHHLGMSLAGTTLGVVGLGRIGGRSRGGRTTGSACACAT